MQNKDEFYAVRHGNSKALVIDKALLQAAGLDKDIDPNGGLVIQSVVIYKPGHRPDLRAWIDKTAKLSIKATSSAMKKEDL
jgi:antitoxin component of MazEF toxin-antitoxin module